MRRVILLTLIMLVSVATAVSAWEKGDTFTKEGVTWTRDESDEWSAPGRKDQYYDEGVANEIRSNTGIASRTLSFNSGSKYSLALASSGEPLVAGGTSDGSRISPAAIPPIAPSSQIADGIPFRQGSGNTIVTSPLHAKQSDSPKLAHKDGRLWEFLKSEQITKDYTILNHEEEKWAREQSSDAILSYKDNKLTATTKQTTGEKEKESGVRVTKEFTDQKDAEKNGYKTTTEYLKDGKPVKSIVDYANTRAVIQHDTAGTAGASVVYEKSIVRGGNIVRASDKPLYADLGGGKWLNYEDGKIYSSAPTSTGDGKVEFSGTGADAKTLGKDSPVGKAYQEVKNARLNFRIKDTLEAAQFHFTEYQGLSGYSSLFFKDKDLAAWRRKTEEFFCSTILFGGIDCWTSKICDDYDDRPGGDGVFIGTQLGGDKTAIAHIEAERSLPATFLNGTLGTGSQPTQVSEITEYVYKMTYFVRNPQADDEDDESDLSYNIVFEPGGYRAFPSNKPLKPGASASAVGQAAIVKYSRKLYTKVCLVFSPALEGFSNEKVSRVCNLICGGIIDPEENECKPLETAILPAGTAPKPTPSSGGTEWSGF